MFAENEDEAREKAESYEGDLMVHQSDLELSEVVLEEDAEE